jgi:hypothetical protein
MAARVLSGDFGFAHLWPVEELVSLNRAYEVEKYLPGLLLGSDGAGKAYGFHYWGGVARGGAQGRIIPEVPSSPRPTQVRCGAVRTEV